MESFKLKIPEFLKNEAESQPCFTDASVKTQKFALGHTANQALNSENVTLVLLCLHTILTAMDWIAAACVSPFLRKPSQAPLFIEFSKQEYWNGLPFPIPGDVPDAGIEPVCLALAGGFVLPLRHLASPLRKPQNP